MFSPDKSTDKFNLGTWPKGEIRSFTFDKRCDNVCDAVMLCNVHPEMESYVVVMQNPYFAKADEEGNFKINNIPAGTYLLKIWNPKLKSEGQEIVVSKDGTVEISIPMKK